MQKEASAILGGAQGTGLSDVSHDLSALDGRGRWAVAIPYDGEPVCARFDRWQSAQAATQAVWRGPAPTAWTSSLGESDYCARVQAIRSAIAEGSVYQANLCRVMSAVLPNARAMEVRALWQRLFVGNPSPYGGYLDLPEQQVAIASASPELFLSVRRGPRGRTVRSGPIKGTGPTASDLSDKDTAENVMIVDLVRNDLGRVCVPGTITVPDLLAVQEHPGLVHLVSSVEGLVPDAVTWPDLVAATFPPGSVTGAPKIAAMSIIEQLEPVSRDYYCGALGWVDADTGEAELAVAIRTFWIREERLHFGTGAGITWGSDPEAEWRETELKASRLISLASG